MLRRSLAGARDLLVLAAAILVALLPVAHRGVYSDVMSWSVALATAVAGSVVLALLGLFMTWGDEGSHVRDEGSHVRNATSSLAVLIGLSAGVIALMVWGASTAGGGS